MLSLKTIGASSSSHEYYAKYCQEKGEAQGIWTGEGADALSLSGKVVQAEDMKQLLYGFSPDGKPLCKNAGANHRGGWDLTFSAPKSFSLVWANVDRKSRERLEQACQEATDYALAYLQEKAAFSRVGEGGTGLVRSKLVASKFFHSSNRSGDPQAHIHAVIKNVGLCDDGVWRTLQGRYFFDYKMTAGALFKLKLSEEVQKLGYRVKQGKDFFEVVGVSKDLCDSFSSRSQQIEERLAELGYTRDSASPEMIQKVTLETRQSKKHSSESRRSFAQWQKMSRELGFGPAELAKIRKAPLYPKLSHPELERVFSDTLDELTLENSTFSERALHHKLTEKLIGKVSGDELMVSLEKIREHKRFVAISGDRFTTTEMFKLEKAIVRDAILRENEGRHAVSDKAIAEVLSQVKFQTIKPEQLQALRGICQGSSAYAMVRGLAGVGKTYTIDAIERSYSLSGYKTLGCSLSHKAVSALRGETAMEAHTIHHLLGRMEAGSLRLTKKHVIFCDEAAMIDSRLMSRLCEKVNQAGAKMVLVGDDKQIQSVDAGGMFTTLYEHLGGGELSDVIRQNRLSERAAILSVREGKVEKTLDYYEGRKGAPLTPDIKQSVDQLLSAEKKGKLSAMAPCIYSEHGSFEENLAVRGEMVDRGRFKDSVSLVNSKGKVLDVSSGDRLRFSETAAHLGISKDEIGTVLSASAEKVVFRSQSGTDQSFDPREFKGFSYGFVIEKSLYEKERGFSLKESLEASIDETISRWKRFREESPEKSSLIISSTNTTVSALNLKAREYLKEKGELSGEEKIVKTTHGEIPLCVGDRIILTDTKRHLGLYTNDVVTVKKIEGDRVAVLKSNDSHRAVEINFSLGQFNSFRHGYAITAHKSQASTVDRSFVLVDTKFFDREKFYVALSRTRDFSQIVVNREILGDLSEDKVRAIKELPESQQAFAHFRAFKEEAAKFLNRSHIKETSQTGLRREDILKLSPKEKREATMKMLRLQTEVMSEKIFAGVQGIRRLALASQRLERGLNQGVSGAAKQKIKSKLRRAVLKI
ncbi:MAG: MobF family relaxase [Oligoflexus sp.]